MRQNKRIIEPGFEWAGRKVRGEAINREVRNIFEITIGVDLRSGRIETKRRRLVCRTAFECGNCFCSIDEHMVVVRWTDVRR